MTDRVEFMVDFVVRDEGLLTEYAGTLDEISGRSVPGLLEVAVVNPSSPPLEKGYEIFQTVPSLLVDGKVKIILGVVVHDADAVVQEARACYEANWSDSNWHPASLEEALYEIIVASNANPSPSDIGFEIEAWHARTSTPLQQNNAPKA